MGFSLFVMAYRLSSVHLTAIPCVPEEQLWLNGGTADYAEQDPGA
jgi:hypothetical protein